jgi:hypothetical protein
VKPAVAVLSGLAFISLVAVPVALASREPGVREREEITNWYSPRIRNAPVECVSIFIRISSRNAAYALTYPQVLNALKPRSRCLKYASNGLYILRKRQGKWRQIFLGSDHPPCSLKVPRDLTPCQRS